jgi:hypothetical protein
MKWNKLVSISGQEAMQWSSLTCHSSKGRLGRFNVDLVGTKRDLVRPTSPCLTELIAQGEMVYQFARRRGDHRPPKLYRKENGGMVYLLS